MLYGRTGGSLARIRFLCQAGFPLAFGLLVSEKPDTQVLIVRELSVQSWPGEPAVEGGARAVVWRLRFMMPKKFSV
jgi:hypothetical protein